MKKALITGITGQDGSYLAEHLLEIGYEVHGIVRMGESSAADPRFWRIASIFKKLKLHPASLESSADIRRVVETVAPDECYHLAAKTFVSFSFEDEASILSANLNGTHAILAALKTAVPQCRFFFAGSSEMFGNAEESPQSEKTRFRPRTVYGISKVAGFELTRLYRESHGMHASSAILFNHESPRRGIEFVTRKITSHVAKIKAGQLKELKLGRTDSKRDWGHAKEYVKAMQQMLQQKTADDYVLATGQTHTVQEFVDTAFQSAGLDAKDFVKSDPALVRPGETVVLAGNAEKARKVLSWQPQTPFKKIVQEMVESDLEMLKTGVLR